jgi:NADH-quinone oxidoreductase subunit C/D
LADTLLISDISDILTQCPEWITPDTRPGYSGYVIKPEHLLEFARIIRDDLGYDYLSSITGVDYITENKMEVVYHAYKTTGGPALLFKTQLPREEPVVDSLVPLYAGAELQEREAYDMFGIRFAGHPDLRRILLWEGFAGYPLRKDWKEPYFEEDVKPFKNRWPEGHVFRIEDKNPFGDNISYPAGFDPDKWVAEGDEALYAGLKKLQEETDLKTDRMIVNLGPQHPSTHGVFRMAALIEGETVVDLKPVMGYLHRNHEKIGERNTWPQIIPFTDRLDYISSMSNNFGYVLGVEKLMNIKPPERADYLRIIMAELTRISSHVMGIGFLLNDLGAFFTPALYALEERELILDIFEAVSGSRMMCNYMRFGGVVRDLPAGVLEKIRQLVFDRLPRKIDELDAYLTNSEIVRTRCEGCGVITSEQAINMSTSGPILRAAGIPYDVRRADPYSIYDRFDFDVVVRYHGDVYDRYLVRLEEIRQSLRILRQAVKELPEGPIMSVKPAYQVRVPAGEAYGRVEGPKGELGYYIISNGKGNPYRYHVRAPSFINITCLAPMSRGGKIADVVVNLGSIDIVLGEVDR